MDSDIGLSSAKTVIINFAVTHADASTSTECLGGWQPRPLRQDRRRRREPQTVESKIGCECLLKANICKYRQTCARTRTGSNQRLVKKQRASFPKLLPGPRKFL